MKKLLLVAAILAIGSSAYALTEGISVNNLFVSEQDTMYPGVTIVDNAYAGDAGGFGAYREITNGDNAVHKDRAVNIFRDKGDGWEDVAATHILLNVLEPIKIESEVDFLYTQAVAGDELQIGDIGFRVKGMGPAEIEFKFYGGLFNLPGKVTVKGHNFYPKQTRILGGGIETASRNVMLYGTMKEIEVDAYLDLTATAPGLKFGVIVARAEYK